MQKILHGSISLLFIFLFQQIQAQQLATSDLLIDLDFLNKAIKNGHPANYQRESKIKLDTMILNTRKDLGDSISWRIYEATVREAVWEIGCVHTSVKGSPIRQKERVDRGFFPLNVFVDAQNQLFLCEDYTDTNSLLAKGDEIHTINGLPVPLLIKHLLTYKSPDGKGLSYVRQIINRNFAALYFIYFGAADTFEIEFNHNGDILTEKIPGKDKSAMTAKELKVEAPENTELFKDEKAYLAILPGNIAYLRIESFKRKCKPFYRKVFRYLKQNQTSGMVIDLRDNLGGSRTNVEILLSYLIAENTSYRIIRPENNLCKYLKGKEKMKFLASYLYFDVGDLFHRKKLEDGVAFTYKIRSKKQTLKTQIYLLINGYSASSSTVTAAYLKHHHQVVVIGEQTSGGEFWNNGGSYPELKLPKSGITIRTATYRFEYDFSGQNPGGIVPDHLIDYNASTYLKQDLEMKKVLELIGSH